MLSYPNFISMTEILFGRLSFISVLLLPVFIPKYLKYLSFMCLSHLIFRRTISLFLTTLILTFLNRKALFRISKYCGKTYMNSTIVTSYILIYSIADCDLFVMIYTKMICLSVSYSLSSSLVKNSSSVRNFRCICKY